MADRSSLTDEEREAEEAAAAGLKAVITENL